MSESKREEMVLKVSTRLLARLDLPPQESLARTRNIIREKIREDPSIVLVINSLIDEICVELDQEDSDCIKYSMSS